MLYTQCYPLKGSTQDCLQEKKLVAELEPKVRSIYGNPQVISSGSSNNGVFYVLQDIEQRKYYVKVVDKDKEAHEGLDEALLSRMAKGSKKHGETN